MPAEPMPTRADLPTDEQLANRLLLWARKADNHENWSHIADDLRLAASRLARIRAAQPEGDGWQTMDTAPKDRRAVLLHVRDDLAHHTGRADLNRLAGIMFVGRHPGLAEDGFDTGWGFAAPVGYGGIPDDWLDGWRPLPAAPSPDTTSREG